MKQFLISWSLFIVTIAVINTTLGLILKNIQYTNVQENNIKTEERREMEKLPLKETVRYETITLVNYVFIDDKFSKENVLNYLRYKGEGGNLENWEVVIESESSWNPTARNPRSAAYGLYQIMPLTAGDYCQANYLQSWQTQTDCAIKIRKAQGWTAWEGWKAVYRPDLLYSQQ